MIYRNKPKRGSVSKKVGITSIVIMAIMCLVWIVIFLYDQVNTKPPASPPQIKVSCSEHNLYGAGSCGTIFHQVILVETGDVISQISISTTNANSDYATGFYWIQTNDIAVLNDIVLEAMPPDPVIEARPDPYISFDLRYINADPNNPQCTLAHAPGYYIVPCYIDK